MYEIEKYNKNKVSIYHFYPCHLVKNPYFMQLFVLDCVCVCTISL